MSWRAALRAQLVLDQPVQAGALFLAVCDLIPLHHAARAARHNVTLEKAMARSVYHMRWLAFSSELVRHTIAVDPPIARGRNLNLLVTSIITPVGRACEGCGVRFLARKQTRYCTLSCRSVRSYAMRRARKVSQELVV